MNLTVRDYAAVLELAGEIHDARGVHELRQVLLPALREMTPADYSSYNEMFADGGAPHSFIDPAVPARLVPVWDRLGDTNPLLARYRRTRDGRPYRFSDELTPRALRSLPLYREFYLPLGVEHQIAFTLPAPKELTIAVVLSRGGVDFSDRERDLLDLARPHIIQAYRNAQFRDQSVRLIEGMQRGLSLGGLAVVVSDEVGQVELVSESAIDTIGELGLGLPVLGSPLPVWLSDLFGHDTAVATVRVGHDPLLVRRAAAAGRVTIVLEAGHRALSAENLASLGLTPRESAVLGALVAGDGVSEVAAALGIRPRTVHKHLQRIYSKLGVRDRGQAIATAWAAAGTTTFAG